MVARLFMVLLTLALVGCGKSAPASASALNPAEMDQLTQTLRKYAVEQRPAPTNLDELVARGYLAAIPSAPAGKKFAIDKNLRVYLANQ